MIKVTILLLSDNLYYVILFIINHMDITTILIISGGAITIYIAFLVLGFSLKGKNIKAQTLEDKDQI